MLGLTLEAVFPGQIEYQTAGDKRYFEPRFSVLNNRYGEVQGFVIVLRDVTAARDALAALEAGEQQTEVRPMRSPWWIVPFAVFLGVEWAIRRRAGLK